MRYRRTTAKTVAEDLRAYASWLDKNAKPVDLRFAAENLNIHLDVLLGDDSFGTEGQLDPRGDHRG